MDLPNTYTSSDNERIRRFVVDGEALVSSGSRHYASFADAQGVPVAEAVLSVPGVQEIVIEGNALTALCRPDATWDDLQDRVRYAIGTALRRDAADTPAGAAPLDDDQTYDLVEQILRRDINPAVANHGGEVELIDVQDGTVVVRMMGGCQGCGMANVTLRQGVEAHLQRVVPGLKGIQDITDHASGTNPYYR